jgi:glycosyltransferase involved in cell wall biosynthesis
VRKDILDKKTDIIHCGNETFWMSILLKGLVKKPIVADVHDRHTISIIGVLGLLPDEAKGALSQFLTRIALRMVNNSIDMFLCPTEELRGFLISSGIQSQKVKAIANVISKPEVDIRQARTRIRATLGLSEETTLVAFHGVLNTSYNLDAVYCLSRISRIVNKKLENKVKFLIMGYYDNVPVFDQNFIYTGYVENLFEYLSAADFAVVPIFENSLGLRSRLLDYIAMSIPVLTTPVGITGIKSAPLSGAVIVRKNVEELAEATIELTQYPEKLKEMSQNFNKLIEWFSAEKIAKELLSSYYELF